MRKLATIRKIDSICPIEGADNIELARTGGWQSVVLKGQFKAGDLAVFFEIDSALPADDVRFAFLKDRFYRKWCRTDGTVVDDCIRLRTIRLKGQISQGLFMPLDDFSKELIAADSVGELTYPPEDTDVTAMLKVRHYDELAEEHANKDRKSIINVASNAKGVFPSHLIPKTDEERLQNLSSYFTDPVIAEMDFECTEKYDGSSATFVYSPSARPDDPFFVCSRNLELKEDEKNIFWQMAYKYGIKEKLEWLYDQTGIEYGIQAEVVGPGINNNRDQYTEPQIYVFRVRSIYKQYWLTPQARSSFCKALNLPHVKVISQGWKVFKELKSMDAFLEFVKGKTDRGYEREGMVWKNEDGTVSFKVINNDYLLKQKD